MLRFKKLYNQYKDSIDDTVKIWSEPKTNLHPYDKMVVPLFEKNENIHEIQQKLKNKSDDSLEFIVDSSNIILEAENATEIMINRGFEVGNYRKIGAKVADAGNMLDDLIENRLNELEDEFVEIYKPIKKLKEKNNLENLNKSREKLDNITGEYFKLNQIFNDRGLNNNAVGILVGYKGNRDESVHLAEKIEGIENDYKGLPNLRNEVDPLKQMKKDTSPGNAIGFGKGELYKKCRNVEYYEGMIELKKLHNEVKDALYNPEKYENSRQSIKNVISSIRKENFESRGINDLIQYDLNRFDSDMIYCEDEIKKYKRVAESANEKIEEVKEKKLQELIVNYERLKKRSVEIVDENVKLREEHDKFVSGYKSENEDMRLANNSLKEQERKYNAEMKTLTKDLSNLMNEVDCLKEEKKQREVKEQLETNKKYLTENEAERWNSKYDISDSVVYHAKDGEKWDVRGFITPNNIYVKDIVRKNNLDKGSLDDIAYNCMNWVQDNFTYVSDGSREDWLFPNKSAQKLEGDCEDGSNLMLSMMRAAGMPAYKIKNACGWVATEDGKGGHSYPIYLREKDEKWVELDWSYLPSKTEIDDRIPVKNRPEYKGLWFTFNDEHSWGPSGYEVSNTRKKKEDFFSLPLYMMTIGIPHNSNYLDIMDLLSGQGSEKSWENRFNNFLGIVQNFKPQKQEDFEYLERVSAGIKGTVDKPTRFINSEIARNTYEQLNKLIA